MRGAGEGGGAKGKDMNASNLKSRAIFYERQTVETDMGGTLDQWVPQFETWAAVQYLRGTEAVMQSRLQSKSPAVVTVRNCADARRITSEWLVEIEGRNFEVKEDPRPEGSMLAMLAEA